MVLASPFVGSNQQTQDDAEQLLLKISEWDSNSHGSAITHSKAQHHHSHNLISTSHRVTLNQPGLLLHEIGRSKQQNNDCNSFRSRSQSFPNSQRARRDGIRRVGI